MLIESRQKALQKCSLDLHLHFLWKRNHCFCDCCVCYATRPDHGWGNGSQHLNQPCSEVGYSRGGSEPESFGIAAGLCCIGKEISDHYSWQFAAVSCAARTCAEDPGHYSPDGRSAVGLTVGGRTDRDCCWNGNACWRFHGRHRCFEPCSSQMVPSPSLCFRLSGGY